MRKSAISIVIPTFQGRKLLARNLPRLLAALDRPCEILVVDDASRDGTASYLRRHFPEVRLIRNRRRQGFGESANRGVRAAKTSFVLLLNSDMVPEPGFLAPLRAALGDERVFAATCRQLIAGKPNWGGPTKEDFRAGLLRHAPSPLPQTPTSETFYVSGGATLFRRSAFLALGGFDRLFAPFYWEDADLSLRAKAAGWRLLFARTSLVRHAHAQTIRRFWPAWYIKAIAFRNILFFNWRHLTGKRLLLHLALLPLHLTVRLLRGRLAELAGFLWALATLPKIAPRLKLRARASPST